MIESYGYTLMELTREHWIRRNNVWSLEAKPQIIWGDAVFLISYKTLAGRLEKLSFEDRLIVVTKLTLICLAYRYYDYAVEIIDRVNKDKLLDSTPCTQLKQTVLMNVRKCPLVLGHQFIRVLCATALFLVFLPLSGRRKQARCLLRSMTLRFLHLLAATIIRNGPHDAVVVDTD